VHEGGAREDFGGGTQQALSARLLDYAGKNYTAGNFVHDEFLDLINAAGASLSLPLDLPISRDLANRKNRESSASSVAHSALSVIHMCE